MVCEYGLGLTALEKTYSNLQTCCEVFSDKIKGTLGIKAMHQTIQRTRIQPSCQSQLNLQMTLSLTGELRK